MAHKGDLTAGPVWAALFRLAAPMVIGIVAVLSIALADTYFVSRLGTAPLAALSFSFPVALTITSLAIGLGAGAASLVSRAVGAGDRKDARRAATDSLILALILVALISGIGLLTVRPLFALLGAEGEVLDLVVAYMRIWYYSMPFLVVPLAANAIIRSVGDALWPSIIMVLTALVNVALTPVFVFGLGPIGALGIEGAAWGTFLARAFSMVLAFGILVFRERLIDFRPPPLDELAASWRRVVRIGVPAALGNATNPLGIAVVTALLAGFGEVVVAGFGVATRIENFGVIPLLALSAAIGPMCGQNWGAGKPERVREALIVAYAACVVWTALLTAALFVFGEQLAAVLASGADVRAEAGQYLTIVPISLFGYGITIVAAGAYNALGRSLAGLGFYLVRVAGLLVPLSGLAATMGAPGTVYLAIAAANVIGGAMVAFASLKWLGTHGDRAGPAENGAQPA